MTAMSRIKRRIGVSVFMVALLGGVIGAVAFMLLYQGWYSQSRMGVVRMDHIIAIALKDRSHAQADWENQTHEFAQSLDQAIASISETYGVTLVSQGAVVSELPDYTDMLLEHMGGSK
jgi:hypothetical protein